MLRLTLAALHLVALGIGLGAVWARARALTADPLDGDAARRAFAADAWWGAAAVLWIGTGAWRLLAGTEKATAYYLHNTVFLLKMGGLVLIFALELWPAAALARWRSAVRRVGAGWRADGGAAARIRLISYVEAGLVLAMVVAATAMARGYGSR